MCCLTGSRDAQWVKELQKKRGFYAWSLGHALRVGYLNIYGFFWGTYVDTFRMMVYNLFSGC